MSLISDAVQGIVSGLLSPITTWLNNRQQRQQQAATDAAVTLSAANKDDVHAQSIDTGVATDGASAVDDGLRKFTSGAGS